MGRSAATSSSKYRRNRGNLKPQSAIHSFRIIRITNSSCYDISFVDLFIWLFISGWTCITNLSWRYIWGWASVLWRLVFGYGVIVISLKWNSTNWNVRTTWVSLWFVHMAVRDACCMLEPTKSADPDHLAVDYILYFVFKVTCLKVGKFDICPSSERHLPVLVLPKPYKSCELQIESSIYMYERGISCWNHETEVDASNKSTVAWPKHDRQLHKSKRGEQEDSTC